MKLALSSLLCHNICAKRRKAKYLHAPERIASHVHFPRHPDGAQRAHRHQPRQHRIESAVAFRAQWLGDGGVLLVLVALSSCGSTSTASATATTPATLAPATVGPAPSPVVPRLSDSYVFVLPGVSVGYLDLRDGIAAATELVPNPSPPPAMCVLRQTEEDLTYTQSGTTLTVRARLIAPTPFTINPDGSISHEVPQADGTVTTNVFVSGSNVAYNAASARLASGYATCG